MEKRCKFELSVRAALCTTSRSTSLRISVNSTLWSTIQEVLGTKVKEIQLVSSALLSGKKKMRFLLKRQKVSLFEKCLS